ncbi:hypothetical protein J6590_068452 [Homalodisca vitripennis]|nr:hypothetical protein J6590_068452 [Homalodisca vitripennis]
MSERAGSTRNQITTVRDSRTENIHQAACDAMVMGDLKKVWPNNYALSPTPRAEGKTGVSPARQRLGEAPFQGTKMAARAHSLEWRTGHARRYSFTSFGYLVDTNISNR